MDGLRHLAPTAIGEQVRVRSELTEVDRNRLTYSIEALEGEKKIGVATHRASGDLHRARGLAAGSRRLDLAARVPIIGSRILRATSLFFRQEARANRRSERARCSRKRGLIYLCRLLGLDDERGL